MNVRLAAAQALDEVVRQGRSLSTVMPVWQAKIGTKDRALLQELCYGVLRWYHRLDAIAAQLLRKPFKAKDTDVRCLILVGIYQLHYLRVPDHAAVSETVAAVKGLNKPWAKGLVNAVLRGFQRLSEQDLAALDQADGVRLAHPDWLLGKIRKAYPEQWLDILSANNQYPPMSLRVNARQAGRDAYLADLPVEASALDHSAQGIVLDKPTDVEALPGFAEGRVSVQDGAAQLAAGLLAAAPGERILDACAAPGGKTAHVLETQPDLAAMVALDIDELRLQRVSENLTRLKLNAEIVCADASQTEQWWDGQAFDRIMLDAPCSATGVIRRHPDIKLLRRPVDIDQLVTLQAQILRALWPLLKPGGMLLYMTCSVLPQENVKQLQAFFSDHDDVSELPIAVDWGMAQAIGRQILPGQAGMDGFYYARLLKGQAENS